MQNLKTISTPHPPFPAVFDPDELAAERFRWTVDEYYRASELGVFDGRHVELVQGDILIKTDHEEVPGFNGEDEPRFRWTSDLYYQLADGGVFEGKHVELINGEIIEMAPMGPIHATAIDLVAEFLRGVFGKGYLVRVQAPIDVDTLTQPEPDIVVLIGSPRDFKRGHPKSPILAVEIADSSIRKDRVFKAKLYAEAGIEDYWIVNLAESCVEVYRRPNTDADQGHIYLECFVCAESESLSPLARPDASIKVADILP
ncbi:MAG: Uma2 family endonuclease [Acidobacteria bacterium]|nr:Uma2 family endonuclease [Acidobacteriota bacterium]